MTSALIGHTGFVGGNLKAQRPFDALYSSRDIDSIRGKRFELVVCAGAYAAKWKANAEPEADRSALERLMAPLREVEAERFLLISTVDVYPRPVGVDEESPIDERDASPYGRHRRELEQLVAQRFPRSTILRLPGLFGQGLKKNVIYDLLHDNQVDRIHPDGVFQYYGLGHLWADASRALESGLELVNLATEPVSTRELALRCFGRELSQYPGHAPARYDFRTRHAALFGGSGGYVASKEQVLGELKAFVQGERRL